MNVSQSQLAMLYVSAALLGVGLGFFYDLFRILRILVGEHFSTVACRFQEAKLPLLRERAKTSNPLKLQKIVIFTGDFLFCILSAVAMILLFYQINNGKIRFWAFPMVGVGFCLYRASLGRLVMLCAETAAFLLESAVRYLVFFTLFPFKWILGRLMAVARKCRNNMIEKRRKKRRDGYTKAFEAHLDVRVKKGLLGIEDEKGVRRDARNREQEKAVQSEPVGEDLSGSHRGGVHRRVRQ